MPEGTVLAFDFGTERIGVAIGEGLLGQALLRGEGVDVFLIDFVARGVVGDAVVAAGGGGLLQGGKRPVVGAQSL